MGERQGEMESLVRELADIKSAGPDIVDRLESACFEHMQMVYTQRGETRAFLNGSWRQDLADSGELRGEKGVRFLMRVAFRDATDERGRAFGGSGEPEA